MHPARTLCLSTPLSNVHSLWSSKWSRNPRTFRLLTPTECPLEFKIHLSKIPYLSNLSSQCSIPLLDLTETCLQYQFLNPAQYLGEVFGVLFDFSLCSLESIPIGFDFIGLEMGTTSSTDFKVPEKILVYNQCSQLRTSAESNGNLAFPEGHNYPFQQRAISSPRHPQVWVLSSLHYYPSAIDPNGAHDSVLNLLSSDHTTQYTSLQNHLQTLRSHSLFSEFCTLGHLHSFQHYHSRQSSNTRASQFLELFSTSEPLAHMVIPQTRIYIYIKLVFWWKFPLFKELAPSFLKQHWFFVCLNQKAKTNQFPRKIAGKFNQPYKQWCGRQDYKPDSTAITSKCKNFYILNDF